MILRDRRKLARLMTIQDVTHRDLARVAGYSAHSYISRLVRGEVTSLRTDPALRIAHHLNVAVEDLFLPGASSEDGQTVPEQSSKRVPRRAKRRSAA